MTPAARTTKPLVYPSSDGKPIAENTLQYRWIVTVQGNLDLYYLDDPAVFVAGDHLIYPVEGDNKLRQAPDVYVAFGRPKGDRGSYQVWLEGGVFPQVVFEVLSPGNRAKELADKLAFYVKYGVEEYYILDPDRIRMRGYLNGPGGVTAVADMNGWVSPRLGIRFGLGDDLEVYYPDGSPFRSFVEIGSLWAEADRRADRQQRRADREKRRADREAKRAEQEADRAAAAQQQAADAQQQAAAALARADALAERLRALGLDPDAP